MAQRKKAKDPRAQLRELAAEGYRRLAFGPVGDVVRLLLAEEGEYLNCDGLDLYCVTEMKRGKGTMEVKLASRLEALDRLAALAREEGDGGDDAFYTALSQGAKGFYHREEVQDGALS